MPKTTDELQVEALEDMHRDGMDILTILYAMWEMGENGNQIAHRRVRAILQAAMIERRENQVSEPFSVL